VTNKTPRPMSTWRPAYEERPRHGITTSPARRLPVDAPVPDWEYVDADPPPRLKSPVWARRADFRTPDPSEDQTFDFTIVCRQFGARGLFEHLVTIRRQYADGWPLWRPRRPPLGRWNALEALSEKRDEWWRKRRHERPPGKTWVAGRWVWPAAPKPAAPKPAARRPIPPPPPLKPPAERVAAAWAAYCEQAGEPVTERGHRLACKVVAERTRTSVKLVRVVVGQP